MRYTIRRSLVVITLIALPLLLLGVAPALQELIDRMDALEGQVQTLEGESQIFQQQIGMLESDSALLQQQLDSVQSANKRYKLCGS